MARIDAAMELSPQSRVRQWLLDLAPLVAVSISASDAAQKLDAYVGMLEYPAAVYTKASLAKAARRFKFFPTFAELADFFDGQLSEVRIKRQRLQAIVNAAAGQKQIAAPEPQTLEQRQHMGALFGKLADAIGTGNFNEVMAAADSRRSVEGA
ncbi:hypothetical protein [Azospirillum himalayense]|uniref:Uncharacterized protein n=1 Tax=Azospirillum himalayense TaxID=654847 RepID=A0ABW0FXZ2_9PROT